MTKNEAKKILESGFLAELERLDNLYYDNIRSLMLEHDFSDDDVELVPLPPITMHASRYDFFPQYELDDYLEHPEDDEDYECIIAFCETVKLCEEQKSLKPLSYKTLSKSWSRFSRPELELRSEKLKGLLDGWCFEKYCTEMGLFN